VTDTTLPPAQFQQRLLAWFDLHGRKDLPWQQDISPYRIWVSEIMLQQTQVVSVIAYFNRFMMRFPDLHDLARADLDDVLKHWAGLGYYARARNLHKTARILSGNGGTFPQTLAEMIALPGIGRSTAGAILSIACGQRQPILDGNVKRVLTRFHGIQGWPGEARISNRLWQIAETCTPTSRVADYTQAMMDLGATLCTRSRPRCHECPVQPGCQARRLGLVANLPTPKPRKALPIKQIAMLILRDPERRILLTKRPASGIWGGLWSLPEFETTEHASLWCALQNLPIGAFSHMPSRRHGFSHYCLDYTPLIARLQNPMNNVMEADKAVWYKARDIAGLGLPAPVRQLLNELMQEDIHDQTG